MSYISQWKKWARPVLIAVYSILLTIALPLCVIELNRKGAPRYVQAWFVGGLFVMLALPVSLWGMLQHLINYTQPYLQRHILRILWMVPIYAVNAWFALRFPEAAIYLDTLRECYEAYVIYNFMVYLLNYLWNEYPQLNLVLKEKAQIVHICPFCMLPPWPNGRNFISRCKHGVLQYTIVRPVTTIIALICEMMGKYDEGDFNFTSAWSYLVIINNLSQIWAMYCLILFYRATKEELAPIRPIPKFLCVKFVVFFSFWQSVFIAALVKLNAIPVSGTWVFYHNIHEVATGLQDFCICVEMFLAAVGHYYSFSHKPYVDMASDAGDCCTSFLSMWDVSDVKEDFVEHVIVIGKTVKKTVAPKAKGNRSEKTPLLDAMSMNYVAGEGYSTDRTRLPNTPPVHVTEADFYQGADSQNRLLMDDSISFSQPETFIEKSMTPSMNNYLEFSTITSTGSQKEDNNMTSENMFQRKVSITLEQCDKEPKFIDFDSQKLDQINKEQL
ncbi:hypothetical protein ScPMuIL_010984 [Solemya velum]